jgi:uncharacterized radical SAM superfamily protein
MTLNTGSLNVDSGIVINRLFYKIQNTIVVVYNQDTLIIDKVIYLSGLKLETLRKAIESGLIIKEIRESRGKFQYRIRLSNLIGLYQD